MAANEHLDGIFPQLAYLQTSHPGAQCVQIVLKPFNATLSKFLGFLCVCTAG